MPEIQKEANSQDRIVFTTFITTLIHAFVIFGIVFTVYERNAPPPALEVTIAHTQSDSEPDEADFIAQNNQEGSGTSEDKKLPSTTEIAPFQNKDINRPEPLDQVKSVKAQSTPKPNVLTTNNPNSKTNFAKGKTKQEIKDLQADFDQQEYIRKKKEMESLEAKLAAEKEIHAKRPKRSQLTAVSAKTAVEAQYLDNWRQKVETIGTANFPQAAKLKGLKGSVIMQVSINKDGTLYETKILKSSGHRILDTAALQFVRIASPFEAFDEELAKKADILDIVRTWKFEQGGKVTSE
jgi:protein TonB